jgi:hypothetical protein
MQLTGHKTRAVFERYNITSPGDLREAAQRLDAYAAAVTIVSLLDGAHPQTPAPLPGEGPQATTPGQRRGAT